MKIQGATALVTGANRGLGKALVSALLEAGAAKVYAAARSERHADVTDARVVPLRLDTTSAVQIAAAARHANDVTLLVNNAGVLTSFDVLTAPPDALEADFRTNALGTLGVIQGFVPVLERAPGGATIVNVLSLAALAAVPPMGGYSASKAAAYAITQALRPTLRDKRIEVLAALPGPIDTDMIKGIELPKTSASAVAEALVAGVERGDEEIFPDPMSQQMSALWTTSPKLLERALASGPAFATSFTVDRSPDEVFAAINDVRAWWDGDIEGTTDALGAEFTYRHGDLHRSTQKITEWVPGKKVVWHVVDSHINFVRNKSEWHDTHIQFDIVKKGRGTEVRFTHVGLVPAVECYDQCSAAWSHYINDSLFRWICRA